MIKFGFHINIDKGLIYVPEEAKKLECSTIQIFSRNPRGWSSKEIDHKEAEIFRNKMKEYEIAPLIIHMPYLPNPASPEKDKYDKSFDSMIEELNRAAILNAEYINIHIGKRLEDTKENALQRVITFINTALNQSKSSVTVLLENTAGQGTEIGSTFEEIHYILTHIKDQARIGVCLDTAHLFAAGYDLKNDQAVSKTLHLFDKTVGLNYLKLIHYNDSLSLYQSHVDRHEHIGKGSIGNNGMKAVINSPLLKDIPFILETPKKHPDDDHNNLKTIKKYLKIK